MAMLAIAPLASTVRRSRYFCDSRWLGEPFPSARDFFHRRKYVLIVRIGSIAVPADERTRLGSAEPKWWMHSVDCDWKIDVPLLRAACLVLDECAFGPHGAFAPYHDDAFCRVQLGFDCLSPSRPAADLLVPPDRIAVRLQIVDERLHAPPVFSLV